MDLYQLISYPLYAGGILQVALGIALLKQADRRDRAMRAGAVLFFSAACFTLLTAVSYTLESQGRGYNFFNRASWIGWFMIPACLQLVYYLQDENSRAAKITGAVLYPFWSVVLALTLFTDLVEPGDPSLIPYVAVDGPLEKPLRLIGSILAVWLLVELYRIKQRTTGLKKAQFDLFFYGTLFFNVSCIMVAGILPLFGAVNPAFTTFFSLPWVVITYYAITRHRLFDLRFVLARVLSIAFTVVLFSAAQIGLFRLFAPEFGESFAILISLSVLGVLFFGTRINRRMQAGVQRLVLQDKYDYQKVFQESIQAINSILDLDELLGYLIASMKKSLGVERACFLLRGRAGNFIVKHCHQDLRARVIGGPEIEILTEWGWQLRNHHAVVREELEQLRTDGPVQVSGAMNKIGVDLVIPLIYKGDLKGLILLGRKDGRAPYLQSDIDLLETLAAHAAVAIENAQLYEESRQAKESMRESEGKFRSLAETAPAAIFIHQGGNFLYANPASERMLGYTREEFLAMDFWGVTHPDDKEMIMRRGRSRFSGDKEPPRYEFRVITKTGEVRWLDMTVGTIEYEGKKAVIGNAFDITGRKQIEAERERFYQELQQAMRSLQESEARFRTLTETTTASTIIHRGGKFLYSNPAVSKTTGYTFDELQQMEFWELVHPEYREEVRVRALARVQGEAVPAQSEFKIVTKTGDARWVSATAGSIEFGGKPAIIAALFDITDRKKAEEDRARLHEESERHYRERIAQQERFSKILSLTRDGFWINEQNERFVYVNDAYCRMTGYSRDEVMQMQISDFDAIEDRDAVMLHTAKIAQQGYDLFETQHRCKDGGLIDLEVSVNYYPAEKILFTFFRDITARKKADEEKVRLYEDRIAEEKRHLMEKEKILMDLHDGIGGITTNISILSELAQKEPDIEGVKRTLATISRLSREGIGEIRGIMHSLDTKELNWRTMAAELRNQGTNLVEPHNIGFSAETLVDDIQDQPTSLVWVNLFKIYKEALTNVVKHAKARSVAITLKVTADGVLLIVRDDGIGRKVKSPSGRGLSNMGRRAEEIGGRMTLSSENGTQVHVEVPLPIKYPS